MEGACHRNKLQAQISQGMYEEFAFRMGRVGKKKISPSDPPFQILDTIDNPGSITLHVSCVPSLLPRTTDRRRNIDEPKDGSELCLPG